MKAKEYYAKYGEQIMDPKTSMDAVMALLADFAKESQDIMKQRKISKDTAILGLINEMNTKWNSLACMFPTSVLKINGYRDYMYMQLGITKEDADFIRGKRRY